METMTQETMPQFIDRTGLKMRVVPADRNPYMNDPKWSATARHWRCIIAKGSYHMTAYFSQGFAHTMPPTLAEVLDCLASDAAGYRNARSFEEWAADYGCDVDSRRAERTYRAVSEQTAKLVHMLGEDDAEHLIFYVERM